VGKDDVNEGSGGSREIEKLMIFDPWMSFAHQKHLRLLQYKATSHYCLTSLPDCSLNAVCHVGQCKSLRRCYGEYRSLISERILV